MYTVVLYLRATVIWMDKKRVKFIAIAFALVCAHGPLSRLINRIMVIAILSEHLCVQHILCYRIRPYNKPERYGVPFVKYIMLSFPYKP